jgi:endonuclease/exonuclease/phosphatase family metal-dependent hydrolase
MRIRIGTWNVQYARGVDKNVRRRALLDSRHADVWVLTETHDDLDLSPTHVAAHSTQRYVEPGGRWTSIWSTLPIVEHLEVDDPSRCVAVRLDGGPHGELVVYGTVLPWNGDAGPSVAAPARGWSEFYRVVPEQVGEWDRLRRRFPDSTLVVAGDLNHNLTGPHYYGTRLGRSLLSAGLGGAGLTCLTTTVSFADGVLEHGPIDHVCAGPGRGGSLTAKVEGWNRDVDGVRLSDHGGTLAEIDVVMPAELLG